MALVALSLLGCTGVLRSSAGNEDVRGALWFPDAPLFTGVVPHAGLVVLANSPMSCEPEAAEDDPTTDTDEAAAALVYWKEELISAYTREDALVVFLGLYSPTAEWDGTYELSAEAWDDPASAMFASERAGFGGWMRVDEASVEALDGMFYVNTPTQVSYDKSVDAPASATIEEKEGVVRGEFAFSENNLSGRFRADACTSDTIWAELWQMYLGFGSTGDDIYED